jgi:hypothetical protein
MDLHSLLPDVTIGRDTSGYLKLSPHGVAVGTDGGRWFVHRDAQLVDVTPLVFDGMDGLIYKVPVPAKEVTHGDLLIIAEQPSFSALFVHEVRPVPGRFVIEGINPERAEYVSYSPPENLLKQRMVIKVMNPFKNWKPETTDDSWLQLALLSGYASNGARDDRLKAWVTWQLMGQGKPIDNNLLLLLALLDGGPGGNLETLIASKMLGASHLSP